MNKKFCSRNDGTFTLKHIYISDVWSKPELTKPIRTFTVVLLNICISFYFIMLNTGEQMSPYFHYIPLALHTSVVMYYFIASVFIYSICASFPPAVTCQPANVAAGVANQLPGWNVTITIRLAPPLLEVSWFCQACGIEGNAAVLCKAFFLKLSIIYLIMSSFYLFIFSNHPLPYLDLTVAK